MVRKGAVRVLFARGMDRRLKNLLPAATTVATVEDQGWSSKKQIDLLKLASKHFDVLLYISPNAPDAKKISRHRLSVVVLEPESERIESLERLMPQVNELLRHTRKHHQYLVSLEGVSQISS